MMADLNESTTPASSSSSVNRYFSETNFCQVPNPLFLYALERGEPFDLCVYSFLYSACFNRRKGDFNTKFNLSTVSEHLATERQKVRESLKRLVADGHIELSSKSIGEDDWYLEVRLKTRIQGRFKFVRDVKVG